MTDERSNAHTDPAMTAPPMVAPSTSPGPAMPTSAAQHPGVPPHRSAPQYPSAAQPYQPAPPATNSSRVAAIVIGSIAGCLVLVALMFVVVFIWLGQLAGSNDAAAPDDGGGFSATEPETGTGETAPNDTDTAAAESIAAELEAKIAEYKNARDTGALWNTIPDTEFNRTAVSAFLYLLTDMKVATIWGVDEATAQEYAAEMAHLEELLLSEQPLGSDIEIVLRDRTFRYDGDTGEGGYSDE